jgi:septal ring factor EnvC (AmiA/AmiB activator)
VTDTSGRSASEHLRPEPLRGRSRLLLFILLALLTAVVGADDTAEDKARQMEQLRAKIEKLRATLSSDYGHKSRLEKDLRQAELNIARHSRSLKQLAGQLIRQRSRLRELQQDKRNQRRRLGEQQRALAQQIKASYAMGRQGYLKILLSNEDPSRIGRTLTYYRYFNQARARRINDIGASISELEKLETTIGRETRHLEQLHDKQQQAQQQREREYDNRHQILVKLDSEIGDKEQRLKQLIEDKERLARLLEQLRQALSDIPPEVGDLQPFAKLRGKLSLPARGRISHHFGSRRRTGKLRWQGITIDAAEGNEVRAIYHGRVAFADWLRNFGMLIIIDHGDGYMSLYAHNQALYRDVGEWVDKGDVIATIGNSGGQDKSGLYFEIRHNGTPTNPARWITAARR